MNLHVPSPSLIISTFFWAGGCKSQIIYLYYFTHKYFSTLSLIRGDLKKKSQCHYHEP